MTKSLVENLQRDYTYGETKIMERTKLMERLNLWRDQTYGGIRFMERVDKFK